MLALKPPFRANDMEGLYKKVIRGFYPRIPPNYSSDIEFALKMLLQVTPHLRASCGIYFCEFRKSTLTSNCTKTYDITSQLIF